MRRSTPYITVIYFRSEVLRLDMIRLDLLYRHFFLLIMLAFESFYTLCVLI